MGYNRVPLALFFLRWSVFLVMLMWTLDKFVRPSHAAAVYDKFYFISDLSMNASYVLGGIEMLIIIGFLFGLYKTFTYGMVFLFHAVSTLSSYSQYFSPFESVHLLFFAAWPMLAACFALFYLRELDTIWTYQRTRRMF